MYILLCGFPPFFNDGTDVQLLFDQIMNGQYDFPDPYWTNVSADAKDLVAKFLTVNPSTRITAVAALEHPWLKAAHAPKTTLDVASKLKEFNARRKK